jgi:hypothetical protein
VAAAAGAKVGVSGDAGAGWLPGPAQLGEAERPGVGAENAKCEDCHREVAAEWRRSMHRQAFTDTVFQQAYGLEPFGFCRGCHAPESDPAAEPSAEAADLGVSCVTCHVAEGEVVGPRSASKPHAVRGDARLATRAACAACHQFDFPRVPGQPMQDTLTEHRRSTESKTECQTCHMQEVEGKDGKRHRSHDFAVLADPAFIQSAVKVVARRGAASELTIELTADRIGHAFPTGDMFRRLEVRAQAYDATGKVVHRAPAVHLARRFADQPLPSSEAGLFRAEISDTRVPAPGGGPRVARLVFDADVSGLEVRWVVAYQRMDHAMAASFGVDPARDEIVVAQGIVGGVKRGNERSTR